jgi:hypothetical protein
MNKIKITEFKIILKDYYLVSTNKIYSSRHWTYRNKIKKDYAMWFLKYKNKLPKFDYKIDLEFNFYFKNKGYDSSNCSYMGKIIEDLLVKNGVIKDDNRRWVGRVSYISRKGDENYCELIIKKSEYENYNYEVKSSKKSLKDQYDELKEAYDKAPFFLPKRAKEVLKELRKKGVKIFL